MSYVITFAFVAGVAVTLIVQHYRGWILGKLGVTFPPKPPPA